MELSPIMRDLFISCAKEKLIVPPTRHCVVRMDGGVIQKLDINKLSEKETELLRAKSGLYLDEILSDAIIGEDRIVIILAHIANDIEVIIQSAAQWTNHITTPNAVQIYTSLFDNEENTLIGLLFKGHSVCVSRPAVEQTIFEGDWAVGAPRIMSADFATDQTQICNLVSLLKGQCPTLDVEASVKDIRDVVTQFERPRMWIDLQRGGGNRPFYEFVYAENI